MTNKFISRILLACILWSIFILVICLLSSYDIPDPGFVIPYLDKYVHALMFFVFNILLCSVLIVKFRLKNLLLFFLSTFISFLYGGIIELLQQYSIGRSCDIYDLFADLIGAFFATLLCIFIRKYFRV